MRSNGNHSLIIPRNVWVLGIVSLLMDLSSEMILSILPIFLVTGLGISVLSLGLIEGLAEGVASMIKAFSGALSDYLKKRKILINSLTLFEVINIIIYSGFSPVFVDNKKNTFQTEIDLNNFKSDLNEIAGIVVTHLNGINHNIIQLKKQIEYHNNDDEKIYLIEDCAVAMGAQIDGKRVGTFGDFGFLSFNIMKNITSYTGGVLLDNQKMIEVDNFKYRKLSKIDILKKAIFVFIIQLLNTKLIFPLFFKFIKYSYKYSFNFLLKKYRTDFEVKIENNFPSRFCFLMHDFQKKILLNQFKDLEIKQINRTSKSKFYFDSLKKIKNLNFPQDEFNEKNIFLEFPIICDLKKTKNELFEYLLNKKIDVKNYYYKNCSEEKIYSSDDSICLNSKSHLFYF